MGRKSGSEYVNKNKGKITSITSITSIAILLALMPYEDNATTLGDRLASRPNRIERSLLRQMLSLIFSMIIFISIAVSFVPVASASGGAYTLKWYAADPAVNKAPYLPAYEKLTPSQLACPGTAGRYPDPLNDSVAYGPTYNSSNLDAVTSLAPKDMALGQIVPFEVEIAVNGDTGPENGTINFTGGWNTNTTSSDDFGYDSAFMVYCAFVDTADPGTIDPGNNAKVDSFTSELANPGTKDEEIQGTFQISGLDNGDNVIVEVWVVLKPTIPSGSTGNVQSRLVSAQTVATEPDDINTGNQIIPLLQVQEFFSADADISVNKTDSPDPVTRGQYLNYTLLVKNNSPDTIANGINVTDTLDPNTTFVSASGAPYNNTTSTVTFNVGALSPGQNVTLFINTAVSDTAPIDNDTSENPEAGSATLPTISYDLLNSVSVASITDDSNTTNNTYYQPTNVLPAFEPSATLTLLKQISNSSTGPWSSSITVPGGSPVYYNFTVINTGNVPLSSLSINDSLVNTSGITPPWPEPLEVLTSASRIAGPVTAETLAGTYPNTATANGTYDNETYESGPSSAEYIVAGAPAYTIDKIVTDVAGKGPTGNVTKAGDVITYQINVTNTGNVDLTNITVNDTLIPDANLTGPTGDNAPTGVLDRGETWTYKGTYTATQADINSNGGGDGLINNTATVDSDQLSPKEDTAQVPIEEIPIEENPAYTINKTVTDVAEKGTTANVTKAGEVITYQITVNNTGNVDLTNVTVNDTLIGNLTGPTESKNEDGILEVGETWIFTGNYTVTQADINSNGGGDGFINNTATVDSDELEPLSDSETVPIEQNPEYTIDKIVTDVADQGPTGNVTKAGEVITYQITVNNTGNVDLTNVTVTDSLIENLADPSGDNPITGVLEVGESWIFTGNYTVTQADINSNGGGDGLINNTATVDSDQLPPEEDTAQVPIEEIPIEENPAYTINKTVTDVAGKGPTGNVTRAGDVITYQITVNNTGNVDLTNITVNDTLIENLTGPTADNPVVGVLEVGETWTYTGTYTVTQADINSKGEGDGLINNTATVDSDQLGPKSDNAEVPIAGTLSYTIDKTVTDVAGKGPAANVTKTGEIISYQINVTNTGNVDLTNVTVTDSLIENLTGPTGDNNDPGVLNPGETWTYTGTYTVTQADINTSGGGDGLINNTATVDSDQLPPQEDTAQVPIEEIPIEENPAYTINKTVTDVAGKGPAGNVTKDGDVISYQINVTNTGNVDLTNITLVDSLISAANLTGPAGDSNNPGVLNVRETWTYTGTYKVTQADINNNGGGDGVINNTAKVDSDQLGPKSDNAEVPIEQKLEKPDYCIYKSIIGVDKAGDCIINEAGDIIEYQVAVKNIGKGNLTNVTVNDSLITLTGPTGDNIDPGILNPGETWKYKGNYTVTQEDINSNGGGDGDIDNTATVSCNELPDENSTKEQKIVQTPDYCIYKSIIGVDQAGDCIINEAGDIIEYQIAVKNIGNVDLTGISVNDTLITLTGPTGDNIEPGVLNPGEKWKYKGNYTVTQADINTNGGGDGNIDNTATVSSNELPDENSSVQQPIAQKLDLCIYKSIIGADRAGDCIINEAGDIIEYQIAVKNNGKGNLTNVTVNDSLITLTKPTGDNIDPGILNPGETWKYKGNYTVTQEDINSNGGGDGDIDNTATVSCNELPDENSSKKQPIVQTPDYCIYKSIIGADRAGDCIINDPGDIIEYQIAVKNIGNVDLTGISVNDTLITLTGSTGDNVDPQVLNPGETWKYKGNYTVTQNDINSNGGGDGDIDNTATVSCNELPDENSSKEQLILLASTSTNNADITPTPTYDVDQNGDDDSGDGGSSGGGGGGGGSPEPAGNIKVKELAQAFVTNGKEARFNFTKNATCVVYVSFDAKKTMGKITTTVEMLKGKSTLTRDAPEGEVYDYLNIWVGSGGYATEKNIENAVVCFKVEKARMEEKGINESSITLNRYNDGKWSKLPVSLLKEDNKYLYFTAKTPGFSPFAITGQTNGLDADIRGTESESEINASEGYTEYTESETEQKDGKSTPGFELVYGIVSLLAIFLYRRK